MWRVAWWCCCVVGPHAVLTVVAGRIWTVWSCEERAPVPLGEGAPGVSVTWWLSELVAGEELEKPEGLSLWSLRVQRVGLEGGASSGEATREVDLGHVEFV